MGIFTHDPDAVLVYGFDWSEWLPDTDSIATSTWTATEGITVGSSSIDGAITTVSISGGTDKANYTLTNHVITAHGLEDDRSHTLKVRQR